MDKSGAKLIDLQRYPYGVSQGIRTPLFEGRFEIVSAGPNPEFGFIGSDPYDTNAYTGLVVPSTPSSEIENARYLFLLARASFQTGERGVRLVGIRQYAELIARIPAGTAPLESEGGPPTGSTVTFRKEIVSPLWHPPDGNISWHVMIIDKRQRDRRHPANTDGFIYQMSTAPALLFQEPAPYVPPNDGRPWGKAIKASLGNIHELRYPWRDQYSEYSLDIPIQVPCDVVFFASVRQNDPTTNPTLDTSECAFFGALSPEDQFLTAYSTFAQYGTIAGSLVFDQNLGCDVP